MEKLYEQNSFIKQFIATVLSCTPNGDSWDIVLTATAFYPEGGGQPYDTGRLGNVEVTAVHTREGVIVHTCTSPLDVGATIEGNIDWERRFDLMQNHSGEHIVSGLAHSLFGCDNVGFHMGSETITIDFNTTMTVEDIQRLEYCANQYICENHAIQITYPTAVELDMLQYRSKKELSGQVRIVSFQDADTCACCGTHVTTSSEVGFIKLLSCQPCRQGVRIEMVSGGRALRYLSHIFEENRQVSQLLSAKISETAQAVARLKDEKATLEMKLEHTQDCYFSSLCAGYANKPLVILFEKDLTPVSLRRLADMMMGVGVGRCAVLCGSDTLGYQYAITQKNGDLRPIAKKLNQELNGRGGGQASLIQGSIKATGGDIQDYLVSLPLS